MDVFGSRKVEALQQPGGVKSPGCFDIKPIGM